MTFEDFKRELTQLVQRFAESHAELTRPDYSEAKVRDDFLNPLFEALGWDLRNKARLIQTKREVEIESPTRIGSGKKRADYLFRVEGRDRFVCEAKKPSSPLDKGPIFQAKRYAWNKDVPLAVLSDFEEIKLYIVGSRPDSEEPAVGEYKTLHFTQYLAEAQTLWDLLARDNVQAGSIDHLIESLPKKAAGKGKMRQGYLIKPDRTRALDVDFLNFLDEAREQLAKSLVKHNERDTLFVDNRLNEATQRILDRLLFLRICEDRDIDTGIKLESLADTWKSHTERMLPERKSLLKEDAPEYARPLSTESLYRRIARHFRELDRRPAGLAPFFNGQLFKPHFSEDLEVGDDFLLNFIGDLADENSPYLFNVIPVEILGAVYERFLGKVVRIQGRGVTVEEKPEVRKAGGVYYTPRYIVDYIVEQTVGKQLEGKAADKTLELRILDPACGSGSFLIRAFERMCEHWQEWLTRRVDERTKARCWVDESDNVHLTVALKHQILRGNIFGVDLDAQAVEVSQLSLYLKMLEGETRQTLARQKELFGSNDPLLPELKDNIKCGNSLIASDFSLDPADLVRVRAFDWQVQFEPIMKTGGFDTVIGNPPYLNIDDTWGKGDIQLEAIKLQYPNVYNDKTDLLFYFIAKAHDLTKNQVSFIVSRAFLEAFKANNLRGFLAGQKSVAKIVDFQNFHVFDGVGITTCILQLEKKPISESTIVFKLLPDKLPSKSLHDLLAREEVFERHSVARNSLTSTVWTFAPPEIAALNSKLDSCSKPLGSILHIGQGMQTGCNEVFGERTISEMRQWKVPEKLFRFRVANSDIQRYEIRDRGEVLLWVEECSSFDKLPTSLRQHLESCSDKLKNRAAYKRGNCDWWRFTWPLHQEYYSRSRLISPFLATKNRFALVEDGKFIGLTDTIVLFDNKQPESLKFLLALLNSRLLTLRFRSIGKLKGGGIYEYFWNSVSKLPIRRIDFSKTADKTMHDKLVEFADKLLVLAPKLREATTESEKAVLQNAIAATDQQIDALVYDLYGLSPEEIALVEGSKI